MFSVCRLLRWVGGIFLLAQAFEEHRDSEKAQLSNIMKRGKKHGFN